MEFQIEDPQLAALVEDEKTDEQPSEESKAAPEVTDSVPAPEGNDVEQPKQEEAAEPSEAEDETGNRYVPKKRFDQVYAKMKELERKSQPTTSPSIKTQTQSKDESIEIELLTVKYPQFDPNSESYDASLDELGAEVYRANPGITRTEAARRALGMQKKITEQVTKTKEAARQVKAVQSDQGMTSRSSGKETSVDPNSMSLDEMENYLKTSGSW